MLIVASFVLIHRSWHGCRCFDPGAERLRAAGHRVVAPDLPGMGGTEEDLAAALIGSIPAPQVTRSCRGGSEAEG